MKTINVTNSLLAITIACCLSVAWLVHGLPEEIARAQRGVLRTDTVEVTVTKTADVKYSKELLYVDAQPIGFVQGARPVQLRP